LNELQSEEKGRRRRQLAERAINLAMAGDWPQAVEVNRRLVEEFDPDAEAWNRLGKAYAQLGRIADARRAASARGQRTRELRLAAREQRVRGRLERADQAATAIGSAVALKVLRTVNVGGAPDAIAYDPATGRIYADEDDGTHVYVVDAKTFKLVKSITIPGHKPEYLASDPKTHNVYQNIDNLSEIAVIDAKTLAVKRTIATPEFLRNHGG